MSEYYYIVASLPMLSISGAPPISSDEFLAAVEEHLPLLEAAELRGLSLLPATNAASTRDDILKWNEWETSVRNRVASLRSKNDASAAERAQRPGGGFFTEVESGVREAFAKSNPLERENHLDQLRWAFCDALEQESFFGFAKLAAYRLKLLICEKRAAVDAEKGAENYDFIIKTIYDNGRLQLDA